MAISINKQQIFIKEYKNMYKKINYFLILFLNNFNNTSQIYIDKLVNILLQILTYNYQLIQIK